MSTKGTIGGHNNNNNGTTNGTDHGKCTTVGRKTLKTGENRNGRAQTNGKGVTTHNCRQNSNMKHNSNEHEENSTCL